METNRAKYNCEVPGKHKQPNPHQNTFYRSWSLWSHHKPFHCVSWERAGGSHSHASEPQACMTAQTEGDSASPPSSESWPWLQQCLTVLLFHTCKTPGGWHLASQHCSTSFSHTFTQEAKIFGGSGLWIILLHLLVLTYRATRPEARIFNAQDWRISVYWLHDEGSAPCLTLKSMQAGRCVMQPEQ